jgi:hypothetical protein
MKKIEYKYNEGESIKEIQSYIDATYEQHYSRNKFQATEFIIDAGHGTGFNIGNMMKYTQRYGRKGDPAEWRKDLMKVIHYAIMQLHVHDTENKDLLWVLKLMFQWKSSESASSSSPHQCMAVNAQVCLHVRLQISLHSAHTTESKSDSTSCLTSL